MDLKELLKSMGLSDEQIIKIMGGVDEKYKGYVPKHRFDEVNEAKKQLETDLKDRDKQLTDLKKSVGDNEDLKKQIETLQNDNKTKDEQYQAKIKDMQVSTAIKLAIHGKVHDADLIVGTSNTPGMLDKSKIEVNEDGTVKSGLDDQIKALQESKAFLFVEKPQDKGFQFKGAQPAEGTRNNGDNKGQTDDFGKRLADFAKGNESLDKARASYFE
ncbi:hypothetical protein E1B06_14895 [Brevibacillus laterosporus]|uniref:phage scaffolding protein n=1 Tax=Brevibacillus laterosporus TaxID=1465 RepID=UPI002405D170|nr:phage scaffolding protein [Brevibacillus laterosporus]MDF9412970.1 hypothetical protein [Brevibacillus laterosporus]